LSAHDKLLRIYHLLWDEYGPQHWWPADSQFEVIVGAILTQSTAWINAKKAIDNLKNARALTTAALRNIASDKLAGLLYSCGYYNAKAKKLKAFVQHLYDHYNDNLDTMLNRNVEVLRSELLSLYGVGDETADSIILYAANKPIFVIDTYTRRIFERLGFREAIDSYINLQTLFMKNLLLDSQLFNEYHALLVRHGKELCKNIPLCRNCCIEVLCRYQSDKQAKA